MSDKQASSHSADRIVFHLDLDCFFAAVEEREDPSLKGRPVIIGSDPKGGEGRGIVATCNYLARRFGLHSAMPISTAFKKCPNGIFLRPRFKLYSGASRKVMAILGSRAEVLEQAGIDEAYLEARGVNTFEDARALGREIQRQILEEEGLSISVGIAPNKLVAKIASDHKKPAGITVVIDKRVQEFLDPKDVGALRGVGPKTREHLCGLGYKTVAHLREASEERLMGEFGKFGYFLWRQARGLDWRPLETSYEAKSTGREHTFGTDTGDAAEVRRTLQECVERVHRDMIEDGHWCHTLTIKVRFEGYETHSKQTTLKQPTGDSEHLKSAAMTLLAPFLLKKRRFRLVGFSVSKLTTPEDLLPLENSVGRD